MSTNPPAPGGADGGTTALPPDLTERLAAIRAAARANAPSREEVAAELAQLQSMLARVSRPGAVFNQNERATLAERARRLNHGAADRRGYEAGADQEPFDTWHQTVDLFWAAIDLAYPPGFWDAYATLTRSGDASGTDMLLRFHEDNPWFFRSGNVKERLLRAFKRVDLTAAQRASLQRAVRTAVDMHCGRELREYCRLVGRIDDLGLREALRQRLGSADARVARRAYWLLRALGDDIVLPEVFLAHLRTVVLAEVDRGFHRPARQRWRAFAECLRVARRHGDPRLQAALTARLDNPDPVRRRCARYALRMARQGPLLLHEVLDRLAVADLRRRFAAAGVAAGWIASVEGYPWESVEFEMLREVGRELRERGADGRGQLLDLLVHWCPDVRYHAATYVQEWDAGRAASVFETLEAAGGPGSLYARRALRHSTRKRPDSRWGQDLRRHYRAYGYI